MATETKATGKKYDNDKPRVDLLDPQAIEGLAAVLAFGAKKYGDHNWRGGIKYSRLIAAALRHIFAILRGENLDSESGLPHVDHLGCCWMFLSNMMKTRKDLDDRYHSISQPSSDVRLGNPGAAIMGNAAGIYGHLLGQYGTGMDGNK